MLMAGLKLWKQGNIKIYFAVSSIGKHSYFKFSVQNALICGEWSWNTTVPDVWQHFLILAYQEPFFNPSILDWLQTNIDSFRNFQLHYFVSFHNNSNLGAVHLHLKIFILSHHHLHYLFKKSIWKQQKPSFYCDCDSLKMKPHIPYANRRPQYGYSHQQSGNLRMQVSLLWLPKLLRVNLKPCFTTEFRRHKFCFCRFFFLQNFVKSKLKPFVLSLLLQLRRWKFHNWLSAHFGREHSGRLPCFEALRRFLPS